MNNSNRRKFIGAAAALSVGAIACSSPITDMEKNYPVVHHVFFWLKNPDSKEDREQLIAGVKTLSKIPSVRRIHVGIAASTEQRDVVDSSWGVSELMFFSDLEGQEAYQIHPIHVDFVKKYSHLWDKVIVYDVIEA